MLRTYALFGGDRRIAVLLLGLCTACCAVSGVSLFSISPYTHSTLIIIFLLRLVMRSFLHRPAASQWALSMVWGSAHTAQDPGLVARLGCIVTMSAKQYVLFRARAHVPPHICYAPLTSAAQGNV